MAEERILPAWPIFVVIGVAVAAVATLGLERGYTGAPAAVTLVFLAALSAGYLLPATRGFGGIGGPGFSAAFAFSWAGAIFVLYLSYAAVTRTFGLWPTAKVALYVALPCALLWRRPSTRPGWQEYLAVLSLWLPLQFKWMSDAWAWPTWRLAQPLGQIFAANVGIICFLVLRRLEGVGYRFHWPKGSSHRVAWNLVVLMALLVPLGTALHFVRFGTSAKELIAMPLVLLGLFVFTAWTEEFLFRGIIQNVLRRSLGSDWGALAIASVCFGLAHLNSGHRWNWQFALMAGVAGVFYGWTWMATKSLAPAAALHAAVDVIWKTFLQG
ncbi:MAG TPA: CPBP family intramembrane glutamic endopeptidase [Candidatus Acidoferrales bacterium]